MQLSRRLATGIAALVIAAASTVTTVSANGKEGGDDTRSPIKHTIILFQENISFDHYFGTYGHGTNGIPAGATLTHTNGAQTWGPYAPKQLSGVTQERTCDVDHSYTDMIKMANHGAMDLYLQFGNNKTVTNPSTQAAANCPPFETVPPPGTNVQALANSYYTGTPGDPNAPLQNYWKLASQYTLADNFFQGVQGPSTPGAEWLVAATNNTVHDPNPTGDICNDYPSGINPQNIPNLGAEATAQGTSWAWFQGGFGTCTPTAINGYSAHHNPFQYFSSTADLTHQYAWDPELDSSQANRHQRDLQVLYSALAGTQIPGHPGDVPELPSISWVKAPQVNDGHPAYSGPGEEDKFVGDLVARLKASRYWHDTALVIAFDETGGWWDHVSPKDLGGPFASWVGGSPNLSGCQYPGDGLPCGEAGLGPRMPALVVSPFARKGFVDHDLLDTSSLTKWVEWNHKLPALGVWGNRDVTAGSLNHAFAFGEGEGAGGD
jgi:phospholipase C